MPSSAKAAESMVEMKLHRPTRTAFQNVSPLIEAPLPVQSDLNLIERVSESNADLGTLKLPKREREG